MYEYSDEEKVNYGVSTKKCPNIKILKKEQRYGLIINKYQSHNTPSLI
jgi:hypothetical protein